jgi:hypothetical protein
MLETRISVKTPEGAWITNTFSAADEKEHERKTTMIKRQLRKLGYHEFKFTSIPS